MGKRKSRGPTVKVVDTGIYHRDTVEASAREGHTLADVRDVWQQAINEWGPPVSLESTLQEIEHRAQRVLSATDRQILRWAGSKNPELAMEIRREARSVLQYVNVVRAQVAAGAWKDAVFHAIRLGENNEALSVRLCAEQHAARGRRVLEAAREGHAETHGTQAQKTARWREYVAAFHEKWKPGEKKKPAYVKAGKKCRVNPETIARAVRRANRIG